NRVMSDPPLIRAMYDAGFIPRPTRPTWSAQETPVIIVHAIVKPAAAGNGSATATVQRALVESSDPQIALCAIWIDLINPRIEEDRKVQEFVGAPVPTKAAPATARLV